MPPKLPSSVTEIVRKRADYLCEYCRTNERWQLVRFTIDHVVPRSAGGTDEPENLALACFHCNRRKSNLISTKHPETGIEVPIFNPREMSWSDHFVWSQDAITILPLTDTGVITIDLLELNRDRILEIRRDDIHLNRHPPIGDRIQRS